MVVAANRAELAWLTATNVLGQNTAAIAAVEAQYARMWAQDSAAMYGYAGQSATASAVTPFGPPAQNTNPAGTASQAGAVAQSAGTSAGSVQSALSQLTSATPSALQSLAAPTAAAPTSPLSSLLNTLKTITGPTDPLTLLLNLYQTEGKAVLFANDTLISTIMGLALTARGFKTGLLQAIPPAAAAASASQGALAAGLGSGSGAVSAGVGDAGLVGALSVPPSWAAATPAIRTVAAVLSGTSPSAIPAAAVGRGSLFGGMAVAGMAGGALGAALPRALAGVGAKERVASMQDRKELKNGDSPENLQRLVAEMADKPESVQHWHTDPEHLDELLADLRQKPGTHAVHVKNGKSPTTALKPHSI
jgi:PPE-repeat protein